MLIKQFVIFVILSSLPFQAGCSRSAVAACWDSTQFVKGEAINGNVLLHASSAGGLLIYPRACRGRAFSASPDNMVAKIREMMGTPYAVSKLAIAPDKFAEASIHSQVVEVATKYHLPRLNIVSVENIKNVDEPEWHKGQYNKALR